MRSAVIRVEVFVFRMNAVVMETAQPVLKCGFIESVGLDSRIIISKVSSQRFLGTSVLKK